MKVLLCLLVIALADISHGAWTKISYFPICFETQGDLPGDYQYYGESKLVKALKLKWASGEVRCESKVEYSSKWGCYRHASFYGHNLNVIITDINKNIIYPKPEYIKHNAGLWYWLPGIDERHSDELIFTDFATPFYLPQGGQLKIWYGEDLKNWSETDNQGKVCVEIYALFVDGA